MVQQSMAIIGEVAKKRQEREKKEMEIYREYEAALSAGSYRTDINSMLCEKYNIGIGTLYRIRERVSKRLNEIGEGR